MINTNELNFLEAYQLRENIMRIAINTLLIKYPDSANPHIDPNCEEIDKTVNGIMSDFSIVGFDEDYLKYIREELYERFGIKERGK